MGAPPSDEAASGLVTPLAFSQHGASRRSCYWRRLLSESKFPMASISDTEVKAIKFVPRRPRTYPALRSWHGALQKSVPAELWSVGGLPVDIFVRWLLAHRRRTFSNTAWRSPCA